MANTTRDLNVGLIVIVGLISCVLFFVLVVGTEAWFKYEQGKERMRKQIDVPSVELDAMEAEQLANLRGEPGPEGQPRLPIEQAMQLTLERYQNGR